MPICSATSNQNVRLCVIESRLREALEKAPEVRKLFSEWIDLRFSKEPVCQKKSVRSNSSRSNRLK